MKKQDKLLGKIRLGYDDVVLPLEVAHKIQALLAEHATELDSVWGTQVNKSLFVLCDYEVGAVEILNTPPDFDARGVSATDYSAWQAAIRERQEGDEVMSPQDFAKIRGEQQ